MTDKEFARFLVFLNCIVPLVLLAWNFRTGRLGYNPNEYLLRTTGMLALVFLLLSLCITPLRRITGRAMFSLFRRMVGLYAFFYTALHLLIYLWRDQDWDLLNVPADTFRRPFILFGMLGFLLMVPLALTSTAAAVKRMGAKNWKRLHRLVYVAAAAGVIHYFLRTKVVEPKPVAFILALALLLSFRAAWALATRRRRSTSPRPATISPGEA
jgi:sulfoxide reductase heme-binding subunit YedZ